MKAARSLLQAVRSWRMLSVTLLSFSSGMPLALVWIAIPVWMRQSGVDIRLVGLTTLAQAPWTFKILWAPLMDRYTVPWLGRRRGWMVVTQILLLLLTVSLAGLGNHPDTPWVILALCLAIAFASASQDIVIDAYAVEVLRRDEQGIAVGARIAVYRAAMYVAGSIAITLAGELSWPVVNVMLGLLYLPMLVVTRFAPEPRVAAPPPPTLRDAVWRPFLGFLSRHRALEILAFVMFYKLADNFSQSLMRPFLVDAGYDSTDIGVALGTIGFVCTMVGTFFGGAVTSTLGLGHSLWLFGFLQIFSNVGYILVAQADVNRPLMYGAMGFETLTTGMGMGAFGVLLLRLTQKRFSATQYALYSSLFGLPRIVAGPITGAIVHAVGWTPFFWFTMVAGVPGLVLLARFVPLGMREPRFTVEPALSREPLSTSSLSVRAAVGGLLGFGLAVLVMAVLGALETLEAGFELGGPLAAILFPAGVAGWLRLIGLAVVGLVCGLMTGAVFAARHGQALDAEDLPEEDVS